MKRILYFLILLSGLSSCKKDPVFTNPILTEPLFPITKGSEWVYSNDYHGFFCGTPPYPDSLYIILGFPANDTTWQRISDDTLINGKTYTKVIETESISPSSQREFYVRKENGNYYIIHNNFQKEQLFLKDKPREGEIWTTDLYYDGQYAGKNQFEVLSTSLDTTINNVFYDNVVKIAEGILDPGGMQNKQLHYYAYGKGRIFTYFPYATGYRYTNYKQSLIDYTH